MLHWLAGAKAPEGATDPDATIIDAPETPAPVFAVRAFKHAIFGTPTPQTQAKPRRHSSNERERQRPTLPKSTSRPQITRPKSAGDAQTLAKQGDVPEPMLSPTKGILMTPGTAAARRKTVTFGDHVVDNENKKASEGSKTGLPNDCPGKFPSPWVQPSKELEKDEFTPNERKRGRSKLNEELHRVRDESAKRRSEGDPKAKDDKETIADFIEPSSEAGKYWKREYDIYRANTTREVKKLVAKQKGAKNFAAEKDKQCTELADELRQEKKRADRLERRAAELEAQVKALRSQIENDHKVPATNVVGATSRANGTRDRLRSRSPVKSKDLPAPSRAAEKLATASAMHAESAQQPSNSEIYAAKHEETAAEHQAETKPARPLRTRHRSGNLPSDIWAQNFSSNTKPSAAQSEAPAQAPRVGRTVTSGTDATPLKNLSINARSNARPSSREGVQLVSNDERPALTRGVSEGHKDAKAQRSKDEARHDSLDLSLDLPQGSPDAAATNTEHQTARDDSPPSPLAGQALSSPFVDDALPHPSTPTPTPKTTSSRPSIKPRRESKENHSPSRKFHTTAPGSEDKGEGGLHVPRQSAVPAGGAMRSKDGREVSADRLEAARARLAARGVRHVS